MERFHTADYIEFLRNVNPDNMVGGWGGGLGREGRAREGRTPGLKEGQAQVRFRMEWQGGMDGRE